MDELEPIFAALRPLAREAEEILMSDMTDEQSARRYQAIAARAKPWLAQLRAKNFNFFDMPHDCVLPAACDPWLD